MNTALRDLLALGSESLCSGHFAVEVQNSSIPAKFWDSLNEMFLLKNGFVAFESALYIFPVQTCRDHMGVVQWNVAETWKVSYGGAANSLFSFAEDIFGNQFCFSADGIVLFNCETGETTAIADSLGEWARLILSDYDFLTGHSVAHAWQASNGKLEGRQRLFSKKPFCLGGEYSSDNLAALPGEDIMNFYGEFARQIRNKPDGTQVSLGER